MGRGSFRHGFLKSIQVLGVLSLASHWTSCQKMIPWLVKPLQSGQVLRAEARKHGSNECVWPFPAEDCNPYQRSTWCEGLSVYPKEPDTVVRKNKWATLATTTVWQRELPHVTVNASQRKKKNILRETHVEHVTLEKAQGSLVRNSRKCVSWFALRLFIAEGSSKSRGGILQGRNESQTVYFRDACRVSSTYGRG